MNKKNYLFNLLTFLFIAAFVMSACGAATSSASCAFVVGNGVYDRDLKQSLLPGQKPTVNLENTVMQYFPCNSRNYLVTNGKRTDVAGDFGDRPWAIEMTTPSGTETLVEASAFWTVNQDPKALDALFTVFEKYGATSDSETQDGKVNASTPGWNKMLSENFGPTMDSITLQAVQNILANPPMNQAGTQTVTINDNIWKTKDTEQFRALEDEMSKLFTKNVSKRLGFSDIDLFCGSGNSKWFDPADPTRTVQPGEGQFYCAPVRIEVNNVIRKTSQGDTGSQGLIEANRAQYDAAYELYHEQTDCWLGIQAAIKACSDAGVPCVVNINSSACMAPDGSQSNPPIVLPNPPTPTPAATTTP